MGVAGGDKWQQMAEKNCILRAGCGSEIFGLAVDGTNDRDEMGVCIESLAAFGGFTPFEQYIYRSAAEREGRHDAPSGPGDLDLTIYGLQKFLRLAMQGNPTVLNLLFVKDTVLRTARGSHLQEMAPYIVSSAAGHRYLGYMESQRQRLLGERGQKKVNRPELEEKYGFDTKYAMHILRLGFQGVELLSTGRLTLPLADEARDFCRACRQGNLSMQEVLTKAGDLERELKDLLDSSPLPKEADREFIENWMIGIYWEWWKAERILDGYGQAL